MADVPNTAPESAPAELQALWPLVQQYGISDDDEREQAIEHASSEELATLVAAVDKTVFDLINRYLDDMDNAEEAVPFGDLALAAMEAQIELKARLAESE
ncbi:MAG TPA: hypothetical protein VKF28_00110 [Candidatus Dormibacteraeota bacterium]|nr:hypothetical protein [Candidatus Dormibacteraeota bacterium]